MKEIAAVKLEEVSFKYFRNGKRNILDKASLCIDSGGITVIAGASGSGKSTLAAVVSGLYPENGGFLESGKIELFGQNLFELKIQQRAKLLSMMFQNPDLQFCMDTLRKEIRFCLENLAIHKESMDSIVEETAEKLKVSALLDRKFSELSGGEKQKAALACLFALKSRCIVLDESFANIDEKSAHEIIRLLLELKENGTTIIAIDHRLDLWLDVADEIVLLGEGAKVLARDINAKNIEEYKELFEREGVFFGESAPKSAGDAPLLQNAPKSAGDAPLLQNPPKSAGDAPAAVTLKNFTLFAGRKNTTLLVDDSDAEFLQGKMTAVLGDSGSGKTTTFLSILKQHKYSGDVFIEGENLSKISFKKLCSKIGIVFQNPGNQFISQNVLDEVRSGLRLWCRNLSEKQLDSRAEELLKEFGLYQYRKFSPYMLSQGQQRRLAVLSVLSGNQKILLLDEPTYGQDFKSTKKMMEFLRKKIKNENLTVIFVTHDTHLAFQYADEIFELKEKKYIKK